MLFVLSFASPPGWASPFFLEGEELKLTALGFIFEPLVLWFLG
jgi:hypothetical protein